MLMFKQAIPYFKSCNTVDNVFNTVEKDNIVLQLLIHKTLLHTNEKSLPMKKLWNKLKDKKEPVI